MILKLLVIKVIDNVTKAVLRLKPHPADGMETVFSDLLIAMN